MAREDYEAQVALLVRVLPHVAKERAFALKGGTAINLFYRDLPRLSVDIDLTYLPIKDRRESLAEINEAMDRIAAAVEGSIAGVKTQRIQGGGGGATRVLVRLGGAEIKIETSPVMRGAVHDPRCARCQMRLRTNSAMQRCRWFPSRICSEASCMPQWTASIRVTSMTSSCCTRMKV